MPIGRRVCWFALGVQLLLALSVAKQWLFVGTYRFYLDRRSESSSSIAPPASQRFAIVGGRVEPQILTTEGDRLSFAVAFPWRSQLQVRAVPVSRASVEIAVVERGHRLTLSRRSLAEPVDITLPLPSLTGQLELVNEGALWWSDPRVVQQTAVGPQVGGLLAIAVLQALWMRRHPRRGSVLGTGRARSAFLGALSAVVSVSAGLVVLEVGLRVMGDRLPEWIAADRRNLGEARLDGRWQDSTTYGARLRPRLDTFCQWRDGDIVRLGFLPPDLVRHPVYRFPFSTDAEGFRNRPGAEEAPVAALGDSFTDAMTLPVEVAWPSRLSARLGVPVRNYGTAGFGPGQERRVLEEYVLGRRPRLVVVGFFAGNDLQDAERFSRFEQDASFRPSFAYGWKFKEVVARFDQNTEWLDAVQYVSSRLSLPEELQRLLPALVSRPGAGISPKAIGAGDRLERNVLAGCIAYPELVRALAEMGSDHFDAELHRRLRAHLIEPGPTDADLVALEAELDARSAAEGIDEVTARELLLRLRERHLKRQLGSADPERTKELQATLERIRVAVSELV